MECSHQVPSDEQLPSDENPATGVAAGVATFVNELNAILSTNALGQYLLNANFIDLTSVTNDDLILDLSVHESVSKIAFEYFKELGGTATAGALQLACRYNWIEVVDLLLQKGVPIDVHRSLRTGDTPLIIAASLNFSSLVKTLVEHGADVTEIDLNGKTVLHLAAQHGNKDLCEFLLGKPNVDVNGKDFGKKTPLHLAMLSGEKGKKAASFLITEGADILWEDQGRRSAVEIAAGEGDEKMVRVLIDSVADKDKKYIQAKIDEALFIAAGAGYEKVVTILVEQGANVNYVSDETEGKLSLLHVAAINGQLSIARILLSKNADDFAVDHRKMTPLHRACKNGHLDIAQMDVWKKPSHLNAPDEGGNTPIMLATSRGRMDVVEYLVQLHNELGVQLDMVDDLGYNIIHKAVIGQQTETLELILEKHLAIVSSLVNGTDKKYHRTPLHYAAMNGDESVGLLISHGAHIVSDDKGKTPLHIAARYGHTQCIYLFEEANSGNVDEVDGRGRHIVHQAAKSKQLSLISRHSKAKDFTLKDRNGWTPLHYAAQQGGVDTMQVIIDKLSDSTITVTDVINQVNKNNETPLHLACREGHVECITLLLDNEADVSIKTKQSKNASTGQPTGGRTCLDEAVLKGQETISELIINHDTTLAMLWKDEKFICNIDILIKCYPYSSAAKQLLDRCIQDDNGKKTYLFGILDKVEDDTGRTPERYFAPVKMEEEHKDDLITHDLTAQLILYKWNGFGRWLYFIWAWINVLYSALLTSLLVDIDKEFGIDIGIVNNNATNKTSNDVCKLTESTQAKVLPLVLLVIGVLYIFMQIGYMIYLRTRYFTFNNLFRFLITLFTFLFILPYVACQSNRFKEILKGKGDLQLQFGSIAILLSWINMMFYFRHFFYGIYVIMLLEVLKSWLKSIVVFAILIIGFSLSFYCVLDEQSSFKSPGFAIVKTLVWFIGEISYEDIFVNSALRYKEISIVILIIFFIVMNIAFINLLVGLAVGDINAVRRKAFLVLLKEKIYAVEILYRFMPARIRKYVHKTEYSPDSGCCGRLTSRFGNVMMSDLQQDAKKRLAVRRMAVKKTTRAAAEENETRDV